MTTHNKHIDRNYVQVKRMHGLLRFQQVETDDDSVTCAGGQRVGIAACVLLFLGFLLLCICYLKKSLTATLTLVHNLPNDMVIIRTVQDPNGIIRPEVARPIGSNQYFKTPPAGSASPEFKDSMLPLNPAYPPVRALEANSIRRDSGNIRLDNDLWRSENNSLTNISI
uniref:Uncharacterized protein n=1 Tax=Strigamia maritima TaxID=126957 RepID=T1JAZ1_STRMM